jgi:hypothetical protein
MPPLPSFDHTHTDDLMGFLAAAPSPYHAVASGAQRLAKAGLRIPFLLDENSDKVALEAYPGLLARKQLGIRASYKSDTRAEQTSARWAVRRQILAALRGGEPLGDVGPEHVTAEGAVEPHRERPHVPHRRPERLGHLPRDRHHPRAHVRRPVDQGAVARVGRDLGVGARAHQLRDPAQHDERIDAGQADRVEEGQPRPARHDGRPLLLAHDGRRHVVAGRREVVGHEGMVHGTTVAARCYASVTAS